MTKTVDSTRFLSGITKRMVRSWIKLETPRPTPWTPLSKPLSDCTVALISSGAIALKTDRPFDQEGERQDPWWGDPGYRIIPHTATGEDLSLYHLHVDESFFRQDMNCLLPMQRLAEMAEAGEIGRPAPSHYSFMGYTLQPQALLEESTPAIIRQMQNEEVDLVVLVPA